MSLYSERLAHLKKEINTIVDRKKRLHTNQKIMKNYIFGVTDKAVFTIDGVTITLFHGDERKGFRHIIEGHYHANDLQAIDILNLIDIYKTGMKLNDEGVSNSHLTVFIRLKAQKEHRLVLKEVSQGFWIVTAYRKVEARR